MFSQYFGHYLLNRDLISKAQLADALDFQQSVHVKFGVMAVDEGFMTSQQVEEVHEKQKQMDKRFGEIAIELCYLTNEQVESLIGKQKQSHLYLAQALVDRGYMTIEQFSNALNEYKSENSLSDAQFEAIKSGDIDALVDQVIDSEDTSKKEMYGKYLSLFAKNMMRFIDDQVYVEVSEIEAPQKESLLVHQTIEGQSPLFTAISADEGLFLYIASKYAEEELTEVDEMAKASVSEFLNLHNGIYLVNMSNNGIELSMKPQEVAEHASATGDVFVVTVNTSKGQFQFILSNQPEYVSIKLV